MIVQDENFSYNQAIDSNMLSSVYPARIKIIGLLLVQWGVPGAKECMVSGRAD